MTFGDRLKELRVSQHLTQEELANQLYVTRQTISNWENSKGQPELENIVLLSELFHISIDDLLNHQKIPKETKSKLKTGQQSLIMLIIWSLFLLIIQLILHPYSMIYVLLYSIGGVIIVTNYLRRTKRLANLYGQGENMYDFTIFLWFFFYAMILVTIAIQSTYINNF